MESRLDVFGASKTLVQAGLASCAVAGSILLPWSLFAKHTERNKEVRLAHADTDWVKKLGILSLKYIETEPQTPSTTTTTELPTTTTTDPPPANESGWLLVHQCEGVAWNNPGPVHYGGLGFTEGTWVGAGGGQYAPNAGLATPEQQIIIANNVEPPPYSDTPAGGCQGW